MCRQTVPTHEGQPARRRALARGDGREQGQAEPIISRMTISSIIMIINSITIFIIMIVITIIIIIIIIISSSSSSSQAEPAHRQHGHRRRVEGGWSGVNRDQRERKGIFKGYPPKKVVLGEHKGSFRGYPLNCPPETLSLYWLPRWHEGGGEVVRQRPDAGEAKPRHLGRPPTELGAPDPNPKHLANWIFSYTWVHLDFF